MSDIESMFLATFYSHLVRVACSGPDSYVTVPELTKNINILPVRGKELAKLVNDALWKIAQFEHSHNRPMLTALVVKQDKRGKQNSIYPGEGFFGCAERLNYSVESKEQFWKEQFDAVHRTWNLKVPKTN
ncbi:hypothetical protein BN7874_074 [Phage NCTB]|jgi:hypothetical protein|nr:hypothetical protein BN7874_074 [Phage NCTB]